MRVKQVKIGIRSLDDALNDFASMGEAIERGEEVQSRSAGVYFNSLNAFRKALTQKRLELLHAIREGKPTSLHQLAKIVHRDIKNVSVDVKYLAQIGLVELQQKDNRLLPVVDYERIELDIAV